MKIITDTQIMNINNIRNKAYTLNTQAWLVVMLFALRDRSINTVIILYARYMILCEASLQSNRSIELRFLRL